MKYLRSVLLASIFATFLFSNCNSPKPNGHSNKLEGVWTVVEIINEYKDSTQIISNPQPGIWIFSEEYYSATWTSSAKERKPYQQPFDPTSDEKLAAYSSIVVNTGTYELTDTTLITYPVVARVPAFSGGKAIYELKVESDVIFLTIKEEYSKTGEWGRWLDNMNYTLKLKKK
jgi:hypothetical protein